MQSEQHETLVNTPTATMPAAPDDGDIFYLEKAPLSKAIPHLAVPLMLGMAATVIYNLTDAFFIGQLDNTSMLSGVTLCLPVMTVLMAIGSLFGVGGGTEISRLLGENKRDAAKATASFAFYGSLALGLLIGALAMLFRAPIINLLGADANTHGPTSDFATVLFIGAPFMIATFALEQVVRAEGAAKVSMIGIAMSAALNIALDPLLIFVFHLDVAGAAIATVLSNVIALGYFVRYLQRKSPTLRGSLTLFTFTKTTAVNTFKIGVSELLMASLLTATAIVLNNYSASYGESVVASFGIAFRVTQLAEFFAMGLFMGVVPLLAFNYAAKNMPRFIGAIQKTSLYIGVITVVFCGVCFVFRGTVAGLFSEDANVLATCSRIMMAMLVSALFSGYTGLFTAIFQATGKAMQATTISILRGGLFIPVICLGNHFFGITGIIWSLTVTELLCFSVGGTMMLLLKKEIDGISATASGTATLATSSPATASFMARDCP